MKVTLIAALLCTASLGLPPAHAQPDDKARREFAETKARAEKGDLEAQTDLGTFYFAGLGVAKNSGEAVKWYRKAVEKDYAPAQDHLGTCYLEGVGVMKNATEALTWYRRAAAQNYPEAHYNLGRCYAEGLGVPKDEGTAVMWFRKAALGNHAIAQVHLGTRYYDGRGVPKDIAEALRWWRKAAEQNNADAQNNLAMCYGLGQGVEKDEFQMVEWYRKAAEQNYVVAQNNLAACYANSQGVAKNEVQAYKWMLLAAAQGHEMARQSMTGLERKLTRGQLAEGQKLASEFKPPEVPPLPAQPGKPDSDTLAELRAKAETGNANAQNELGEAFYAGKLGARKDAVAAVKWFRWAAEQNLPAAQSNLAVCYERGDGVAKYELEAYKWNMLATAQGDKRAKRNASMLELMLSQEEIGEGKRRAHDWLEQPLGSSVAGPANLHPSTFGRAFTNSLGMVFVPVQGTKVSFSIWDTRVQDFEAFVKATGHDASRGMVSRRAEGKKMFEDSWRSPGFIQGPTHPVCGVNLDDARRFCVWLTEREQREGRLPASQSYRVPTDEEWSWAVGIGDKEGAGTPKDKGLKLPDLFPWGTQWPPPPGAGNYAGAETKNSGLPPHFKPMEGYRDDFARTSPVGSFKANSNGLYDMGGNVWEWCEDWFDLEGVFGVLRGGPWDGNEPFLLASSFRGNAVPRSRNDNLGFRCVLVAASPQASPGNFRLVTREVSLGKVPFTAVLKERVMSPENRHVAYPVLRGGQQAVFLDGIEGPRYQRVGLLRFSPDGKRLVYAAQRGDRWLVVADGKEGKDYDGVMDNSLLFSPDSQRVAYAAERGGKWLVVVDGKEGKDCDGVQVGTPVFSPNSQRLGYAAKRGGKTLMVVDGKESPGYDAIGVGYNVFSPDSQRVAYAAQRAGKWCVIVDGTEGPECDGLVEGTPMFSPNSQRLAYGANRGGNTFLAVDGKEGPGYDCIGVSKTLFSPDSQHLAYEAGRGDRCLMVVVDGKEGKEFEGLVHGTLTFSPDSQRVAYGAVLSIYGKRLMVVDGTEGPPFDRIGPGRTVFSPDSRRVAYAASQGAKHFVVVDGTQGPECDGVLEGTPLFSPDSKRVAHVAKRAGKTLMLVDGKATQEYEWIGEPVFATSKLIRVLVARLDKSFGQEILRVEIEIVEEHSAPSK